MHEGNLHLRQGRQALDRRFRHHGPHRPQGAPLPRRNSLRLPAPRLSPRRRSAPGSRLRAGEIHGRGIRAGAARHRRADLRQDRRRHFDEPPASAAVRRHPYVRHASAARNWCCCRRPWCRSKASRARSIRSTTCGRRRARSWSAGSSANSAPKPIAKPRASTKPRRASRRCAGCRTRLTAVEAAARKVGDRSAARRAPMVPNAGVLDRLLIGGAASCRWCSRRRNRPTQPAPAAADAAARSKTPACRS